MHDAAARVRHVSPNKARQVPVDMVTQRMMVQGPRPSAPNAHQYKSGIEAIRRIARSEGILGAPAYAGFTTHSGRSVRFCCSDSHLRYPAVPINGCAHSCDGCVLCALCWVRPALSHGR